MVATMKKMPHWKKESGCQNIVRGQNDGEKEVGTSPPKACFWMKSLEQQMWIRKLYWAVEGGQGITAFGAF